jgi:hypothetical protein
MKRYLPHILTIALVLTVISIPLPAHALFDDLVADVGRWLISPIILLVLKFTAFLAALGGLLLNSIVYYTVLQMAENFIKFPAIDEAWRVIRDIANMGFIFVLLYAAIQKILGIGKGTNQLIVKMIVAAILVNFSLFFTKAIIDVSNLLALFFYELIAPGAVGNPDFFQYGISNAFVEPMGIQTLWKASGDFGNFAVMGIMGGIVQIIAAFMFFAIAIMFIVRYVVLVFVLILSPIMFLSMVLPGLDGYAKKWWDALLGQSFFAPVYFLLAWVTIFMINRLVGGMLAARDWSLLQTGIQTANGMDSVNYSQGLAQTFISFAVIIAFMIVSLVIAKSWADRAGSGVSSLTKWAMGAAGGATMGAAGFAGRRTLGRFGQVVADNATLKEIGAKRSGMAGAAARLTMAAGRKSAGSTFDARGSSIYEKLGDQTGVSFGKAGGKGGFTQIVKDKVEKEKKIAESFKPSDLEVNSAERALDDAKKIDTTSAAFRANIGQERIRREAALDEAKDNLSKARARGATIQEIEALEREVTNAENSFNETGNDIKFKDGLVKEAQAKVDKLKGLSEDEARKRKITELRVEAARAGRTMGEKEAKGELAKLQNERFRRVEELKASGMSEKDAKEQAKKEKKGWSPEEIKGASKERQEAYAKNIEEAKFMGMGNKYAGFDKNRFAFVGPVTREARMSSIEIRKKLKDKKPADKLAEELSKAKEAGESEADTTTPASGGTTGGAPSGTSTPSSGPGPSPATP